MDRTYTAPGFRPGRLLHAKEASMMPGGRGVNVSIILAHLGHRSAATGFLAGHTGAFIRDDLLDRKISTSFVNIIGENKVNTFIVDPDAGTETVMAAQGPAVDEDAVDRFFWCLSRLLPQADALFMGGALPPGMPDTFYRDIIDEAQRSNIPTFVTSSGDVLARSIDSIPTVVKIDDQSAHRSTESVKQRCRSIFDEGIDWVISTYEGSNVFCTAKGMFISDIASDGASSHRSADDALMAGMIVARKEHMGVEEAIRFSMACVRESMASSDSLVCDRGSVERTMADIVVQRI